MTKFLFWKRCNWCGKWGLITIGWTKDGEEDYCTKACQEKKTIKFEGRDDLH